jgi:hypothetical protein
MRKTLAILTAVVLFGFSFTFSSCKDCDGNKNKGKDNIKNNPVTDRDQNSSYSDLALDDSDSDQNNSYSDLALDDFGSDQNSSYDDSTLDDSDLTEVGVYLKHKGASDTEIRAMMNIEKEDFGDYIGYILLRDNHYLYSDDNGYHDGLQTTGSCALYAMKRLLFVLGRYGEAPKTLWYRYTDKELRDKLAEMPGGEGFRYQGVWIDGRYLIPLMMSIGVPNEFCEIYENGIKMASPGFRAAKPLLTPERVAEVVAEINKDMPGFEKRATDAQSQAQEQLRVMEEEMVKIRDKAANADIRNAAKVKVIEVAGLIAQIKAQTRAAINKLLPFMDILATNSGLGGLALPQVQADYVYHVHEVMQMAGHVADVATEQAQALVAEAKREVLN